MNVTIEPADRGGLPDILALLEEHGLPPHGLDEHVATTLVAREPSGETVGSAALELYTTSALLARSPCDAVGRGGVWGSA